MATNDYNEVDILYTLMTYVNVSSTQDMYYSIAQKILTHLDLIPTISINDLASLCFTSPATISRFCKDLNCRNFAAFKKEMKLALEIAKDEIHIPEADHAELIQYPEKLVDKIYMDTINSLMQGVRNVQIEDVDHICELIHDAHRIHMYGYQFSRIIANDFQLKMLKLKKFIYSFVNRGDEIQKLETIEKGELVIVISVSAGTLIDSLVAKLKEYEPRILLITMNQNYSNDNVDYVYSLSGFESSYTQSAMMGSTNINTFLNLVYVRYGLLYGNQED
ncbi:MAG: MurR/RpiR family transcriptional regulator [Erysipelotrichaceae bacterium]|nr:MurR/RpiR family transcriptional regulator [Erysipelotrichaceae bacterium]